MSAGAGGLTRELTAERRLRLGSWALPLGLATALAVLTLVPYLYAWSAQPTGRVFMGFFFLGDDANTYLAKMREGWEGAWRWTNRYSTEPGTGAWFFLFWIFLGHLAAWTHASLMFMFHAARVAGAFALLAAAWLFICEFLEGPAERRFAMWFLALGLGCGYVIQALGHPVVLGQQTDTLDWRMPELSAFYSVLALPHFAWAAAFQAAGCVFTLRAAERSSLRYGLLAGLAWLGEASIHAQMPILLGGAFAVALLFRRATPRGYAAAVLAFAIAAPYVLYSYWASDHVPEVLRWSAQWRNNLPPDGLSFALALLPQLFLAALALPGALRRRSRGELVLLAWLLLLAIILWVPNPAGNLRRRFFDGVYLPLVVLAARGMYEVLVPRLKARARGLLPFSYVCFAAMGSLFLLLAPMLYATNEQYSLSSDEVSALNWLAAHPQGIVLSEARIGLYVPAYSADQAYVGQYSETYDYPAKARQARAVLSGAQEASTFAHDHALSYLFWTPEDGPVGPAGVGEPVYVRPGARIYLART
jgi:hypothetical protein